MNAPAAATRRASDKASDAALSVLLHSACLGCHASFAHLYALTSAPLFRIVLRINHDRAEAEDVLQDVYVNAWNRRAQFDRSRGEAMGWLVGIAQHRAISSLRRRDARPRAGSNPAAEADDPYAGLVSDEAQPLQAIADARAADAVRRGLSRLHPAHRESLTLAFYEELSHGEIAVRLGRPLGTVKSWLRRSLVAMRPALEGYR